MTDVVMPPGAIEGAKIHAHARKDLLVHGRVHDVSGQAVYSFELIFDAVAAIHVPLAVGVKPILYPDASCDEGAVVRCEKSVILSFDRKPSVLVKPTTGKHKAQHFEFSKQSGAAVDRPHQEICQAIQNREEAAQARSAKALKSSNK